MKKIFYFFCFSLVVGLLLSGCEKSGEGTSLTPEQVTQIEAASQYISDVLKKADDPTSLEALEAAKQAAQSKSTVELAAVVENSLVVKYKDGGFEVWQEDIPRITPPTDIAELQGLTRNVLAEVRATKASVSTRQAVLINALYEDSNSSDWDKFEETFDNIERILEAKGFTEVKRLNGSQASTLNLKLLSGCSVLVMLGHGGIEVPEFPQPILISFPYAVQIGETWRKELYDADWIDARVLKMNVPWGQGDEITRGKNTKDFAATTGAFWSYYYKNNHFNDGLFLNLACKSSKWEGFRNELFKVGIKGYTGWSEVQSMSIFTAWRMLAIMAKGKTLQQAYDELPYEYKHQSMWGEADLQIFGKDDGLNLTLGGPVIEGPQITIISPEIGTTTTERTCVVRGYINPWGGGGTAKVTISVNGQSNVLPVNDVGSFSHTVGLRVGENIISVSVITIAESSKEVRVIGDFSSDVFWSQLSWNTNYNDIDLHMVPVEGADGKRDECYWNNKVSSWGAELDVDDRNGYGPEHITVRNLPAGKYELYVHYYDSHGQTQPSTVSVAVSANGSQAKIYTLPAMSLVGDIWEVCYITYPAGTIEIIDKFTPAEKGAKPSHEGSQKSKSY